MKVTTYTGKHVFRYLFASKQLVRPYGPFAVTWPVFKEFAQLPSESGLDLCCFGIHRADPDAPRSFSTSFARRVTGHRGRPGLVTYSIELCSFWIDTSFAPEARVIWSRDYADLAGFFAAVEADPVFRLLFTKIPHGVRIFADDWPTRLGERGEVA